MDDERIVDLFWRRDEEAIQAAADKYGGYCRTIARRLLSCEEDVEECLSDTWLQAWQSMPPHRPARLRLFLGKIARSVSFDLTRRKGAAKRGGGALTLALEELAGCAPTVPGADKAVEDRELAENIDRFLRSLPERDCGVFLRRYWYAESVGEIARRCGMKENTVKTSLFRSREKLRTYLKKEGILL